MYYGAGIWGTGVPKKIQYVQNKAARYFLGAKKNASNIATHGDLGWCTALTKQKLEVFRLFFIIIQDVNDTCNRLIKNIHGGHVQLNGPRSI